MRVIISGGGTGGHIYPALAIIEKIKKHEPKSEFIYIGTHNRMEKDLIPDMGIKYIPLKVYGFSSKTFFRNIKNVFLIKKAIIQCGKIMEDFQPDVVIGVGGYVTYPVIKSASKLGIKTFIHEQNAIPGESNKLLAKYASLIGVSIPQSKNYFKNCHVVVTGNPCSERAYSFKADDKSKLGFSKTKKLVVIVAGSLGSYTLNYTYKKFLKEISNESYEVLYITGNNYYEEFIKNETFPDNVKIMPYYNNLVGLLKAADLVITRSGATTISEITALNLPSIQVPSPYVPHNHQYYNAKMLEDVNACVLIEEKNLDTKILKVKINELFNDKEYYLNMKKALKTIEIKSSAEVIYKQIKDLIYDK